MSKGYREISWHDFLELDKYNKADYNKFNWFEHQIHTLLKKDLSKDEKKLLKKIVKKKLWNFYMTVHQHNRLLSMMDKYDLHYEKPNMAIG